MSLPSPSLPQSRTPLLGAQVSTATPVEILRTLGTRLPPGSGARLLFTLNLDHVVRLRRDPAFRDAYAGADLVTLDGAPVALYARLRGRPLRRCPGSDLLAALVPAFRPHLDRPFFVVSAPEVGERLKSRLAAQGCEAGFASPPHGFESDPAAVAALLGRIAAHRPTHVILGLGAPKSEIFAHRRRRDLGDVHVLCVGSAPDFLAGTRRRAPEALRRAGLEWLWRLCCEPRRLARRYLWDAWAFWPAVIEDLRRSGGAREAGR